MSGVSQYVVGFVALWQLVALVTGKLPTWTSVVRPIPIIPRLFVIFGAVGWFVQHMIPELVAWARGG